MTSEQADDGVMVSLPWTPTMSECEAFQDAIPKIDTELNLQETIERLETKIKSMGEKHVSETRQMRQAFEAALRSTNDFLVITANHVQELQNRLKEQEKYIQESKERIDEMRERLAGLDDFQQTTADWCNSLMSWMFGDAIMSDAPPVNVIRGWMEHSPI